MTEIYRGDIYYIMPFYTVTGSEQRAGRPGVVVSNDINNRHSPNVEIVFLTSQEKKPLLPSSYNQRRTVTMTYENVMNMLDYREGHKLDEWRKFCEILRALSHVEVIRNGR